MQLCGQVFTHRIYFISNLHVKQLYGVIDLVFHLTNSLMCCFQVFGMLVGDVRMSWGVDFRSETRLYQVWVKG